MNTFNLFINWAIPSLLLSLLLSILYGRQKLQILPMAGFKMWTSCVGSNWSITWATSTLPILPLLLRIWQYPLPKCSCDCSNSSQLQRHTSGNFKYIIQMSAHWERKRTIERWLENKFNYLNHIINNFTKKIIFLDEQNCSSDGFQPLQIVSKRKKIDEKMFVRGFVSLCRPSTNSIQIM